MFIRLRSSAPEFKAITFRPGFNAIVAERAPDSTDKDSRNARGKTSLLLLLNYVLGGTLDQSLAPLADDGWEMTLDMQMFGGEVSATRSLRDGNLIRLRADDAARPAIDVWVTEGAVSLDEWKQILGLSMFRIEPSETDIGGVSVRTLLSYVVRVEPPKDPLKIVPGQSATSTRTHIAFLLGLDWRVIGELAGVATKLKQLQSITAASKTGLVESLRPEKELALERAALNVEAQEWSLRVSGFRILEDPNSLVARTNELTSRIADLRDAAVVNTRLRQLYIDSVNEPAEQAASSQIVEALFASAGAVLADGFKRQMRDVQEFHTQLLANRRQFLRAEVERLDNQLKETRLELQRLDEQRDAALRTLDSGGALEELNALRAELAEIEARIAAVDMQIEQAREFVTKRNELRLEQSALRSEAGIQLNDSRQKLDHVGDKFSEKMYRLYEINATLNVQVDNAGYLFSLDVPNSGSSGVSRMSLFSFDLTMLEEGATTGRHPDFLVHDSTVFDGVDPRQRESALRLAQEVVAKHGGQYICTINSNDVPDAIADEQWFKAGIVREVLDTEVGGLLGRVFAVDRIRRPNSAAKRVGREGRSISASSAGDSTLFEDMASIP